MNGESSSAESPASFLYSKMEDVLEELSGKALEMLVVILALWELCHEKDQGISQAPIEAWIEILRRIRTPSENPLEQLSQEAESNGDDSVEESSPLDERQLDSETEYEEQEPDVDRTILDLHFTSV